MGKGVFDSLAMYLVSLLSMTSLFHREHTDQNIAFSCYIIHGLKVDSNRNLNGILQAYKRRIAHIYRV